MVRVFTVLKHIVVVECIHVLGIVLLFIEEETLHSIMELSVRKYDNYIIIALLLLPLTDKTKKNADTQKWNPVGHL